MGLKPQQITYEVSTDDIFPTDFLCKNLVKKLIISPIFLRIKANVI
jgi:hypothetical protein